MTCASTPRARVRPDLRVSDAERAAVAERLSKHYADGRLDEAEFNERVEMAMKAKTQSDFSGLFGDLPDVEAPTAISRERRGHTHHFILLLIAVIVIAAVVGEAIMRSVFPWLVVGLIVFLWVRHSHWHHREF